MKKYLLGLFAIVLAVGFSSFTKPAKNVTTPYWEYTSNDNSGFTVAAKYSIVQLSSPEEPGCSDAAERPCIYKEATGSLSDAQGLQTDLTSQGSDANVILASIHTQEFQ